MQEGKPSHMPPHAQLHHTTKSTKHAGRSGHGIFAIFAESHHPEKMRKVAPLCGRQHEAAKASPTPKPGRPQLIPAHILRTHVESHQNLNSSLRCSGIAVPHLDSPLVGTSH